MAFLHSHSCEARKSETDIFSLPPTQTSIESSLFMHYAPVSAITENSPIEFVIPSNSEYIDLAHTLFKATVQILPNDVAADNVKVAPVNNLLDSMFNQVDVSFNHKSVSQASNAYAYRAYIEKVLNYNDHAKESHLTSGLWVTDTFGEMDSLPAAANETNIGLKKRKEFTIGGKKLDLIGHLHADVFNQDRFLINGVGIKVRLIRSNDAFCLMDSSDDGNFTVRLLDASLIIRRVKLSPGVLLEHANALTKTTAKYPITRVEIKSFILNTGITGETLDNIILGAIPKRIIIGLVKNRAFNGDRHLNPFNFHHFNLNYLSLFIDGQQIPSKPLQPNFTGNNPNYIDSYLSLFTGSGLCYLNEGNSISRNVYPKGFTLYAFDLTPDLSANFSSHWNLIRHGTVRLELRFANALEQSVNCLIYAEYDSVIEIDSNREVTVDFNT